MEWSVPATRLSLAAAKTMNRAFLLACALLLCAPTLASAFEGGGVYQRQRMHGGGRGFYGGGFYGYPYYGGYYYQQPIYGSWYTRPYPTHLDYFRLRERTPLETPPCPEVFEP